MNAIALSRFLRAIWHCGALVRVRPGEKGPFDTDWPRGSKTHVELWEKRLDGWDWRELFLPTGERVGAPGYLLGVDADLYKPGAEDSLAELYALGLPRRTVTFLTPRGGEHLLYLVYEPIPSGPLAGFPGIDIKCEGGGLKLHECEYGYGPLDYELAVIDAPELLSIMRGDVRTGSISLDERKPTLVDELAVRVLVEHAGAHGARWTGRGYAVTRPGKDRGPSGTVGVVFPGGVHVFSSAWPGLPAGTYTLNELCRLLGVPDPMIERFRMLGAHVRTHEGPALGPLVVSLDTVTSERVAWLWPWRIPRGRLTMLEGDPSIGKSTLALDIAAKVSSGGIFPDGHGARVESVLVLTAEDNLADTVRPRLEAAGADLARVHALTGVRVLDTELGARVIGISLPLHLGELEAIVRELSIALVIVDVLAAYTQIRGDVYRDSDMRSAILAPLAGLAERTLAAVVLLRHLTKAHGSNPLYAGGGSIGISGAARSMLLAGLHPELEGVRVLAHAKSNLSPLAPSLAYTLESAEGYECARVNWRGESELGAAALLSGPRGESDDVSAPELDKAKSYLVEMLGDGERTSSDLAAGAELVGISKRTLARARRELGVHARKEGRHWLVELDSEECQGGKGATP